MYNPRKVTHKLFKWSLFKWTCYLHLFCAQKLFYIEGERLFRCPQWHWMWSLYRDGRESWYTWVLMDGLGSYLGKFRSWKFLSYNLHSKIREWKFPILFYKSGLFIMSYLFLAWKLTPCFILCLLPSDFLVPDYLNQEQEETLVQYDLGEHSFESNSSVQMPVISQVSSTQNCESTFPLGSLGLTEKEEEMPEQPKTSACTEATRDDPPKSELSSIIIE